MVKWLTQLFAKQPCAGSNPTRASRTERNMQGRSPEFILSTPEKTDAGYSEKKSAQILEGKQQDDSQVKKRKPLVRSMQQSGRQVLRLGQKGRSVQDGGVVPQSIKEKVFALYQANAQVLSQLLSSLGHLSEGSVRYEEQLLDEIRVKQKIQEEIVRVLILTRRGEVLQEALPKDLQDLIK